MLRITRDEVPLYLSDTPFYQSLEEGAFEVPKQCYKGDTVLRTADDVRALISTTRFWGKEGLPKELVFYALDNGPDHCLPLFEDAHSDLQYLQVLFEILEDSSDNNMNIAMKSGELTIVQCLYERGYRWGPISMEYAASNGHLECMKYAHEHGCAWTEGTFIEAAGFGHLQCLQYAIRHGCPDDIVTFVTSNRWWIDAGSIKLYSSFKTCGACAYAADNGQLQMLQYLRTHRISKWNRYTCAAAAGAGHLDCVTVIAAQHKHFDCLDYALAQGCPYNSITLFAMFMQGHPDAGKLLRADGDMWKTALYTVQIAFLVLAYVVTSIILYTFMLLLIALVMSMLYGLIVALWYILV